MWRKRVRSSGATGGRWMTVRPVVLTETLRRHRLERRLDGRRLQAVGPRPARVLRAVLTAAQARPCYLGSVSDTQRALRTQG